MSFHETITSRRSRARHLSRSTSLSEFLDSVRSSLHVSEFVAGFFSNVFSSTSNHDLGLAANDSIDSKFNRDSSSSTGVDWSLHWTRGREQQQVDPGRHGIDERFLKDILL